MGNFPILRTCVMEYVNMTQKFPFSFSKLRYGPFDFNPRKFKIKMELNNIDEGWNSANSLFKWQFVVIEKFRYLDKMT